MKYALRWNGILGITELTLSGLCSPDQRENLGMVKNSAESLLRNDILDSSKMEAGMMDLDPIEFHLHDCLDEALRILGLHAHEKGVELTSRVPSELPDTFVGDPSRLRQIIVNLMGNALKFTEHGEVKSEVVLEERHEESVLLRFSVTDTGVGIAKEKQQAVFGKFTQADGSTTFSSPCNIGMIHFPYLQRFGWSEQFGARAIRLTACT
jgi:two-component system, sensor histidine kinase and response regulator